MKSVFLCFLMSLLLFSCAGRKAVEEDAAEVADSTVQKVTDSVAVDSSVTVSEVPKAADEFFSDFVYSFTSNKAFQYQRIAFPLPCYNGKKRTVLQRRQWRFTRLYARDELYSVFYDDKSSLKLEKSRKVANVSVEQFNMPEHRVRAYVFRKPDGRWMLTEIRDFPLSDYKDAEFVTFYQQFATDSVFQMEHIAPSVSFETQDPEDEFETMTGEFDNDQWPAFRPELPYDIFSNIDYGQSLRLRNRRVLAIEGSSSGFMCLLFFKKTPAGWMLYRFEN